MLDFFKKQKSDGGDGESQLDIRAIGRLMHHFPVGVKVEYYPEYRKELLLDSVVIAYQINDAIVYSAHGLDCDESAGTLEFDDQGQHYCFKHISKFRIILPVFSQSETKLDYVRREELVKVGGLVKGNSITLMAQLEGSHMSVLETIVDKCSILREGFYASQTVAFLEVDLESLILSDQRTHLRLNTNVPVTIQVSKRGEYALVNGVMVDFSDRSVRLTLDDKTSAEALPKEKDDLVVSFNLPGQSEYISLVGEVYRIENKVLVVMLTGFMKKGQVVELGQIEILKIKANLLQHSGTKMAP